MKLVKLIKMIKSLISGLLLSLLLIPTYTSAKEDIDKNSLLSMSLKDLLKVRVTTASKQTQKVADAPSIISVITAVEISQLGANSLLDLLNIIPGFTPLRQLKSDRLMVVRGLALKDGVLVLIDGVPVNDAFDGSFDFYERAVDDIERVEIIRGPGSALYGSYAVSAVIHIFTNKARSNDADYNMRLTKGSFGEQQLAIKTANDLSFIVDDLTLATSFSYSKNDGDNLALKQDAMYSPTVGFYLPPLSNPTLTPTFRQESTEKFNGHAKLSFNHLQLDFGHSQIISYPLVSHLGNVTQVESTIKESTQDRLSLKYKWLIGGNNELKLKGYKVINESKLFGQSRPPLFIGDTDQDGLNEDFSSGVIENFSHKTDSSGLQLELDYKFNAEHSLLFGAVQDNTELVEVEKVANITLFGRGFSAIFPAQDVTSEFMPADVERKLTAVYVQDLWQINPDVSFTTGLRYDDYSDFGSTVNPRLGLVYRLNHKAYSKLLYGQAYKAPAFAQLFDGTPTAAITRRRGNGELQATEIKTFELQLGYDFSDTLHSTVTFFQNDTQNEIFFNSTPGIEQWQNSGQRESQGVEFEIRGTYLAMDYSYFNYSYQQTKGADSGAGADIHPPQRINTGGTYRITDDSSVGFNLSYFSSPDRELNDARAKINNKTLLSVVFQTKNIAETNFHANLSVHNLLDEDNRDEIEASVGLLDDIPLEGRNIRFTLSRDF